MPALDVGGYVELLRGRDRRAAVEAVGKLAASGLEAETVILGLLAPAQRLVGEGWERGDWSVSDEHAATVIVEAALDSLAAEALAPDAGRGALVVSCVEQEWHALPAKMFAAMLRSRGWDVTFLGASVAADDLTEFLFDVDPAALVVSCSVAMNLLGAARVVAAAHAAQVPVLAGGRGIPSPDRAAALGAEGWAATVDEADGLLGRWGQDRPALGDRLPPGYEDAARLDLASGTLADAAMEALRERLPRLAELSERQLSRIRTDNAYILRFLGAAVLLGDDEIFAEYLTWLQPGLARLGMPTVLGVSLDVLVGVLADHPAARRLAAAATVPAPS